MKHETTRTLYDYWTKLRAGRRAPLRLEVDPSAIAPILGSTFVLERLDPLTYSYRLAGTRICALHGRELRGRSFVGQWQPKDRETLENLLYTVTEDAAGAVIGYVAHAGEGRTAAFEMLLLPLARDNGAFDRVIGTAATLSPSPWVGMMPFTGLEVKSLRLLWPAGYPAAPAEERPRAPAPIPPAAQVTPARQFLRVIKGGLA